MNLDKTKKESEYIILSLEYKQDISFIYNSFVLPKLLTEISHYSKEYYLNKIENCENQKNSFILKFNRDEPQTFEFSIEKSEDYDYYKCFYSCIKKINGQIIQSSLKLKRCLYYDTCKNTTNAVLSVIYNKEDFPKNFNKNFSSKNEMMFVNAVNNYHKYINTMIIQYDSIIIYRSFSQVLEIIKRFPNVFDFFTCKLNQKNNFDNFQIESFDKRGDIINLKLKFQSNGNENKCRYVSVLILRLSSICCYIAVENIFPFFVNNNLVKKISNKQIKTLLKFRTNMEKLCLFPD